MEVLLDADPGLRSRFSSRLHLVDYSPEEVAHIAELAARRKKFAFEDGLVERLAAHIAAVDGGRVCQENGRMAVNIVDRAIERLASRLVNSGLSKEKVFEKQTLLTADDFMIPGRSGGSGGGGGDGENGVVGGHGDGVDSEAAREMRRSGRGHGQVHTSRPIQLSGGIEEGSGDGPGNFHGLAPPPESKTSNTVRLGMRCVCVCVHMHVSTSLLNTACGEVYAYEYDQHVCTRARIEVVVEYDAWCGVCI